MNKISLLVMAIGGLSLIACGTPVSQFGIYRQSDGIIGVHAPKSAKEEETHAAAVAECLKLGKRTATIVGSRETFNSNFPMTYLYRCGG